MTTELKPPEGPNTTSATSALSPPPPLPPPSTHITITTATAATTTAVSLAENLDPPLAPKRQRRPSVRLGEIGDQPATLSYEPQLRRSKHPWRFPRHSSSAQSSKNVKARSLTYLANGSDSNDIQGNGERNYTGNGNFDFGHRKVKAKRATAAKRPRTNWVSKVDDGAEGNSREEGDVEFRDFDHESDSPSKEHSPVHSIDNMALDRWHGQRRTSRTRASDNRENDAVELDNNNPESDSRDGKQETMDGVNSWLIELGLSRYAPVFEIHEVDDEVLPLLTLEDLKDMGINAVGSRRKMYTAILKLRKGSF